MANLATSVSFFGFLEWTKLTRAFWKSLSLVTAAPICHFGSRCSLVLPLSFAPIYLSDSTVLTKWLRKLLYLGIFTASSLRKLQVCINLPRFWSTRFVVSSQMTFLFQSRQWDAGSRWYQLPWARWSKKWEFGIWQTPGNSRWLLSGTISHTAM